MVQLTFARGDSTTGIRVQGVTVQSNGALVVLHKQKRPRESAPLHTLKFSSDAGCPVRWLAKALATLPNRTGALFRTSLDSAVRAEAKFQGLQAAAHLTGHSVRIGSATDAFAVGVPVLTIQHRMFHLHMASTIGYIRHASLNGDVAAQMFFAHLAPQHRSGASV